jgi:hypothetical protein
MARVVYCVTQSEVQGQDGSDSCMGAEYCVYKDQMPARWLLALGAINALLPGLSLARHGSKDDQCRRKSISWPNLLVCIWRSC